MAVPNFQTMMLPFLGFLRDGQDTATENCELTFGVGVSIVNSYEIKRIDSDYFVEE